METLQPNQFEKILSSQEKALVMFDADWCPFCQKFKPIFETSANTFINSQQKFYESNIDDDNNPLWERFSIDAVPTIIAFEKGEIISRRDAKMGIGLVKSDLDSILKETNSVA
jgi:thiol-disulfide isomerase/thioredoxin